jgi:hypothetical protein
LLCILWAATVGRWQWWVFTREQAVNYGDLLSHECSERFGLIKYQSFHSTSIEQFRASQEKFLEIKTTWEQERKEKFPSVATPASALVRSSSGDAAGESTSSN